MKTVGEALQYARGRGLERLDALALLGRVLERPRPWLMAHEDAPIAASAADLLGALIARREAGEPLAYLLGEKEFHGLPLAVGPAVLVPRPDTETLVDWALERLDPGQPADVVDLGTGSGAIALAVARARPAARLSAVDASGDALAWARRNGQALGLAVDWQHGDWWRPLAGRRFDMALSNPPYIAEGDPHLAALRFEPALALTSGPDGLDALRAIIAGAPAHLTPGAWLLLEHGHTQAEPVVALLRAAGFNAVDTRHDLAGRARCSGGRWPG